MEPGCNDRQLSPLLNLARKADESMSESEVDRDGAGSTGPGNASAKQRELVAYLNAIPTAQREATLRLIQDLNADAEAADVVNIL
jgi:hypothetical protein